MFPFWIKEHISLKNGFSLLCASLTLFLIYKELVNFTVTKPTVSSKEVKELETKDLPEVVVCLVPGFDSKAMLDNHYASWYYRGINSKDKFVGWNGGGRKVKPSQDIMEEILAFDNQFINDKGRLVKWFYFMNEQYEPVRSKVKPRMLSYPYGRCMSISPPSQGNVSYTNINSVFLTLNDIATFQNKSFLIYFMDKASSVHLYPNEMEITGDRIEIKTGSTHWQTSYKTKISKFQHTQGDPHFACDVYTVDNSYNECVQNNVLELFEKELAKSMYWSEACTRRRQGFRSAPAHYIAEQV